MTAVHGDVPLLGASSSQLDLFHPNRVILDDRGRWFDVKTFGCDFSPFVGWAGIPDHRVTRSEEHAVIRVIDDFSYSAGAMWADTRLWARHLKGWRKVAVVSDADWLENSIKAFGWMMPGDIKVFEPDEILEAKQWLVDLDDEDDD